MNLWIISIRICILWFVVDNFFKVIEGDSWFEIRNFVFKKFILMYNKLSLLID